MRIYIVTATHATYSKSWTIKLGGLTPDQGESLRRKYPKLTFTQVSYTETSPGLQEFQTNIKIESGNAPPTPPIAFIQDILCHFAAGYRKVNVSTSASNDIGEARIGTWFHSWTMVVT